MANMWETTNNKRDIFLDVCRGLAIISVVWLHTLYHSGGYYVPADTPLKTAGLLFDVPFFMFLSGWSVFYRLDFRQMVHKLLKMWIFWTVLVSGIDFAYYVILGNELGGVEYKQYIWQILFQGTSRLLPNMPSLISSLWYMPVYLTVVPLGTLVLCLARHRGWRRTDYIYSMLLCVVAVTYITAGIDETFLFLSTYSWFYLFFFLLGYYLQWNGFRVRNIWTLLLRLMLINAVWLGISSLFGLNFWDLQSSKFPPNILYLCVSMITIYIAIYLRDRVKINNRGIAKVITFVGRNSFCFYFAQGIGGSCLYFVSRKIVCDWHVKILVCFVINFAITMAAGSCFVVLQEGLFKVIKKAQEKMNRL